MNNSILQRYLQGANWLLIIYLSAMLGGCSFRPAEVSPEEARVMQTRELNGNPDEIAKAVLVVLQEMHYTMGNVDMGLGVITAERTSERRLVPISREPMTEAEIDDGIKTFFIIAGIVAVVGFFLAWIFSDSEDDGDKDDREEDRSYSRSHHHNRGPVFINSNKGGADSYRYSMTISLEDIASQQTRIRVSVQGQHLEGMSITESGPVQSPEFYADFYNRLNQVLNN